MGKRRQRWQVGDVFLVRTKDGLDVVGQIVGRESTVLNSVSCAFYDKRLQDGDDIDVVELPGTRVFSVVFVTRDLLDNGTWRVVSHRPVTIPRNWLPYEHLRESGYVGAKVIGSRIVGEFLNAFYGLAPWDDWKDPAYLDGLLISPDKKPAKLVLKA
jgi:hypothetical protein